MIGKSVITPEKCGSDGSMRLHSVVSEYLYAGLFEMNVRVLTTCHKKHT